MQISAIGVLLGVSFALILSSKIAKAQGTGSDFYLFLGMAVWGAVMVLTMGDDAISEPVLACGLVFLAVSDLVVLILSRRQVAHPSVRVHRLDRGRRIAGPIIFIGGFLLILLPIYVIPAGYFHSFGRMLQWGLWTVSLVIWFILALLERIEICGNGVWQHSTLQPWEEFGSFSWTGKTKDGFGLKLDPKNTALAEHDSWWLLKTVKPCRNYLKQVCRIEARIPRRIRGGPCSRPTKSPVLAIQRPSNGLARIRTAWRLLVGVFKTILNDRGR